MDILEDASTIAAAQPGALPAAPILMLVSARERYGERSLEKLFLAAIDGGVNMVQVQEASLNPRDLLLEARRLRKLAIGGVPLIIYDRVDIALACRADGVQLGPEGIPVAAARDAAPGLLMGRFVTSVAEAATAEQDGAAYVVVGPVFSSDFWPGRAPLGPGLVRKIKSKVRIPVLASGGITAGNAHQVIAAGADGVSVTREIVDADDPRAAARTLMESMRGAWETRPLLRDALA